MALVDFAFPESLMLLVKPSVYRAKGSSHHKPAAETWGVVYKVSTPIERRNIIHILYLQSHRVKTWTE